MIKLVFENLIIQDFKTFKGEHSLPLFALRRGLHFVKGRNGTNTRLGSNGAGKSSLWDALVWCLYGMTVRRLRNTDVKPWKAKKGTTTSVSLAFRLGDVEHTLFRSANPNRLLLDDKDIGQEKIDRMIGMSYQIFTNAVVMGQGRDLFFDLEPAKKMELFTEALNLDRWEARSSLATDWVAQLQVSIASRQSQKQNAHELIIQFNELLSTQKKLADAWQTEREKQAKQSGKEIATLESQRSVIQKELDKLELEFERVGIELRQCARDFDRISDRVQQAQGALAGARAQRQVELSAIDALRTQLNQFKEGDVCTHCGQEIRGAFLNDHKRKLKRQIDVRLAKVPSVRKQERVLDTVEKESSTMRKTILTYKAQNDKLEDDLTSQKKRIAEVDGRLTALRKLMNEKDVEQNPHTKTIRDLRAKIADAKAEIDDIEDSLSKLMRKQERAKFWTKGFKDVRLYVIEEVLAELESVTSTMLDEAGLVGWRVHYLMERETSRGTIRNGLAIMIESPESEGQVRWESWSGGEAQRLRIVGALALGEVLLSHAGIATNIEVLDEPTTHTSANGVRDVCDYLADRAKRLNRKIFYCDHQSVESQRFTSIVSIMRDKQGSRIEFL